MLLRCVANFHSKFVATASVIARCRSTNAFGGYLPRTFQFVKKECLTDENLRLLQADCVVLDLEDSVHPDHKSTTRRNFKELVNSIVCPVPIFIRINEMVADDSTWIDDVTELVNPRVSGFLVPKLTNGDEVRRCANLIGRIESQMGMEVGQTKIVGIIESIEGLENCAQIVRSSDRVVSLFHGSYDYASETMAPVDELVAQAAQIEIVKACRRANITPIFGADCNMESHSHFIRQTKRAKELGFYTRCTLTPAQTILANDILTIKGHDLKSAQTITSWNPNDDGRMHIYKRSAYDSAQGIGPPHVKHAQNLLDMAAQQRTTTVEDENDSDELVQAEFLPGMAGALTKVTHSPFEVTLDASCASTWEESFINGFKVNSSDAFSRKLGLKSRLANFYHLAGLCAGLLVIRFSEMASYHLGFYNITQHKPVYIGDTLKARCAVTAVTDTKSSAVSDEGRKVVTTEHVIVDQAGDVVFSAEKRTAFAQKDCPLFEAGGDKGIVGKLQHVKCLRELIVKSAKHRTVRDSHNPDIAKRIGKVFVHRFVRPFSSTEVWKLGTNLRAINSHHFNTIRFNEEDVLTPGPVVLASTASNVLLDYGDILYEEVDQALNINKVNLNDTISTISCVTGMNTIADNTDLEEVQMTLVGVINIDPHDLDRVRIPRRLFTDRAMKPREIERLLSRSCPELFHRIGCIIFRKVIRLKPNTGGN
ncbi:uncharacterized protein LOC141909973 [Tubulanus polymorphus]|uniref:uncharacterized protein LOC141909973 n=1 Tax=Tubulanus polymorphus TaxID=672921 RepID=UPI003DA31158